MKHYLRFEAWNRRAPSVALITGVAVVLIVWGTGLLTRFSVVKTANAASQHLVNDEGAMPDLDGAIGWLNSVPLSRQSLRGKVVLVNFWTYTCINSLRPLPYVKNWASKYQHAGFVVIGVHTPEFSFEHEPMNVENAVRTLNITFPVAIDSKSRIWQSFNNEAWPAQYLVDAKGQIRYHHFGEGDYGEIERVIQELLKENGATGVASGTASVSGVGIEAAPDWTDERSPETYIGYRQAQNFASLEKVHKDSNQIFSAPGKLSLNHWGLNGSWNVNAESAVLQAAPGKIVFRFHSRDLNLVLAPSNDGKPVRFVVRLDGAAPRENSGVDTAPDGSGEIREPRLYQLIRQKGPIVDRTFEIEFQDPGVHALDFTFG
ncbi:redoxin domain-containing protein [Acidicapsa acidisoli]|uniref:redoxin domain-containing protein n=1 Tax=Acidicapsa acidisoli TaxID=1615681 RepID=UPI0021E0F49A|nr:redoxin domain-containing protein [Acidicapsa acidisoli]